MFSWKKHFLYQIDYQHWANDRLFEALAHLNESALSSPEGLYFGSMIHTLNHMYVVQQIWWSRLRGEISALTLNAQPHPDWRSICQALRHDVRALQHWLEQQDEAFFDSQISYRNSQQTEFSDWVRDLLTHMMTHMVHHRGQISAVATRLGAPAPEMDFILYKRDVRDTFSHLGAT